MDPLLTQKIEYLAEFMTRERYDALRKCLENRTRYVTVCMENTFHPQNASAVVRSCEAFGVQEIHAIETLTRFSPNLHIVRGTDKWVDIHRYSKHHFENPTSELIGRLKGQGYRIVATTPHRDDSTPETFDVARGPFALFFGTEHAGISDEVIASADEFLRVPMVGFVESLNISVCAAIILHQLTQRIRNSDVEWQLADDEKAEILYRWMLSSVRDPKGIMSRFSSIP